MLLRRGVAGARMSGMGSASSYDNDSASHSGFSAGGNGSRSSSGRLRDNNRSRRSSSGAEDHGASSAGRTTSGAGGGSPYLHGMTTLPSAGLGLRWARTRGDDQEEGGSSASSSDDDDDNIDHNAAASSRSRSTSISFSSYDPRHHDPSHVNALNRSQRALVESTFIPSVPQCRTIDEALWATHELLSEGGKSPYDDQNQEGNWGTAVGVVEEEYDWLLDGDCDDDDEGNSGTAAAREEEVEAAPSTSPLEERIAHELRLELRRWYRAQEEDGTDGEGAGVGDGIASEKATMAKDDPARAEATEPTVAAAWTETGRFAGFDREVLRRQLLEDGNDDDGGHAQATDNGCCSDDAADASDSAKILPPDITESVDGGDVASSSSSSSEEESMESLSDEESDGAAPPLLLDLAVGRSADFLRSLPLAEPTSDEARFIRRTQIRLLREAGRGGAGGVAAGIVKEYDSDEDFYSDVDSDNSSLRTEEGDEEEEDECDGKGRHARDQIGINLEEDNWLRRTAAELEETISGEYFSNESDPVLSALLAVPWDERPPTDPAYVHGNRASFDKMEPYDEYFSRQLSELDQVQQRVTKRLVAGVRQRRSALDKGMRRIQDLDLDIARAHLEVEAGYNCLKRTRHAANRAEVPRNESDSVLGGLLIVADADARDRLRSLRSVVEEVNDLFGTEATIMVLPTSVAEYLDRIRLAAGLKESVYRLGGGRLSRLVCLADLRERVNDIGDHLASQMSVSLSLIIATRCEEKDRQHSEEEIDEDSIYDREGFVGQYATLLHSRLVLAQQEGHGGCESVMAGWANRLAAALCFEVDKCLARSLLDPTMTAQESTNGREQSEFAQDISQLRQQMSEIQDANPNDMSKLRIIMHNLFTVRFDFEHNANFLPWTYHKLCALVANTMQIYLEIEQWHAAPEEDQTSGESSLQCPAPETISCADLKRRMENETDNQDDTEWSAYFVSLFSKVQASKILLWRHCQSIFIRLLDQFIVYSTTNKAIKGRSDDEAGGDGKWAVQLEGLHDVWQLTKQINNLGRHFVGDGNESDALHPEWEGKLTQIFASHLRGVHVEAMNTMGAILAHETWMLLPIQIDAPVDWRDPHRDANKVDHKPGHEVKSALRNTLESLCPLHFVDSRVLASSGRRSWDNRLLYQEADIACFNQESANPFLESPEVDDKPSINDNRASDRSGLVSTTPQPPGTQPCTEELIDELYQAISSFVVQDPTGQLILTTATQGSLNGLSKWTARLLKVMDKLPLIAADVTKVISNLVDMYLLTVLRMCSGNGASEDVVLDISRDTAIAEDDGGNDSPSKADGHSRQSSSGSLGNSAPQVLMSPHPVNPISEIIDADICAPLPREKNRLAPLREFVLRGHESLSGMVNLEMVEKWDAITISGKGPSDPKRETKEATEILERQVSAAISCLYVAALLDVARDRLTCANKEGFRHDDSKISSFIKYTDSVVEIVPSLMSLATKTACVRAAKGKRIVLEVMMVGSAWKDQRFSEHCNDYVDAMCLRCARIWDNLSSSPRKLPAHALLQVWKNTVRCCFRSLLEGFSKVVICSMEGRALMSMDLATFYAGCKPDAVENRMQGVFGAPEPPPSVAAAAEYMHHVDAYVKAFYFPEEDLLAWIESNKKNYHKSHLVSLLRAVGFGWKGSKLDELIRTVELFYSDIPVST